MRLWCCVAGMLGALCTLLLHSCGEVAELPIPTADDVKDALSGPCVRDEECEWWEVCFDHDWPDKPNSCETLCTLADDCPSGRCGEPVGEMHGRRVCY